MKNTSEFSSPYESHGLAGLAVGQIVYFFYLTAIRAQTAWPSRDYDGFQIVWGYRVKDLIERGVGIPLAMLVVGILVARFFPVAALGRKSSMKALVILVLFMGVVLLQLTGAIPWRTFPTPREQDEIRRRFEEMAG